MKRPAAISDTLVITRALRRQTTVRAPASLAPAVLRRVGLADVYWRLDSPIGALHVAQGPAGISLVRRAGYGPASGFERDFQRRLGRPVYPASRPPSAALRRAVSGKGLREDRRVRFDLRRLTDFESAVLRKALEIPAGQVRPYGWIAREIGRPEAGRAAGSALAKNPLPILIPCHRVVRTDGKIGDYIFGSAFKRALLRSEGASPEGLEELAASGIRYLGSESGRYFCLPSCGGFESLRQSNRVPFRSARQALEAGFLPCEDCRPAA
ncbi:MAG: methylated-DNA--[protein]-cysteine S-methyltransferase [Acidobacteria bacterium]|nr:methylated-DNA--[protein]-cysteine S-methyltransferase [Acidobacteriota bacterium]MCA1611406.1 methylated-DNA--[protein]-cysteine S-methyltransferase [Acidobacteriota bacterium]